MDQVIVGLIIASTVFFLARKLYKRLKSDSVACCGSCASCGPSKNNCTEISIEDHIK